HVVIPWSPGTEFYCVVVDVTVLVCAEWAGYKDIHILRGAKRVDGGGGGTVAGIELRDGAAGSGNVNKIPNQYRMVDGLPKWTIEGDCTRKRNRLPVAGV